MCTSRSRSGGGRDCCWGSGGGDCCWGLCISHKYTLARHHSLAHTRARSLSHTHTLCACVRVLHIYMHKYVSISIYLSTSLALALSFVTLTHAQRERERERERASIHSYVYIYILTPQLHYQNHTRNWRMWPVMYTTRSKPVMLPCPCCRNGLCVRGGGEG